MTSKETKKRVQSELIGIENELSDLCDEYWDNPKYNKKYREYTEMICQQLYDPSSTAPQFTNIGMHVSGASEKSMDMSGFAFVNGPSATNVLNTYVTNPIAGNNNKKSPNSTLRTNGNSNANNKTTSTGTNGTGATSNVGGIEEHTYDYEWNWLSSDYLRRQHIRIVEVLWQQYLFSPPKLFSANVCNDIWKYIFVTLINVNLNNDKYVKKADIIAMKTLNDVYAAELTKRHRANLGLR